MKQITAVLIILLFGAALLAPAADARQAKKPKISSVSLKKWRNHPGNVGLLSFTVRHGARVSASVNGAPADVFWISGYRYGIKIHSQRCVRVNIVAASFETRSTRVSKRVCERGSTTLY